IAAIKRELNSPGVKSNPNMVGQYRAQLQAWEAMADQAQHELGGPDPGLLNARRALTAAREDEARARKELGSGEGSKLDYLSAQLRRLQAQEQVDRWAESEKAKTARTEADGMKPRPGTNPGPGPKAKEEAPSGDLGGGGADD